jgi:hypothetical protein
MTISLPSRYQNASVRQADMTQPMLDLAGIVTQLNAGLAPLVAVTLDAYSLVASIPIPTTPTIITVPTIAVSSGISFDPATGIITILQNGNYQFLLFLNVFTTAVTATIFYGAEADSGSGFVAFPTSGRQQSVNTNINGQVTFSSASFFPAGLRIRIYVWASVSGMTYQTTTLAALPSGVVQVPAIRTLITGQPS